MSPDVAAGLFDLSTQDKHLGPTLMVKIDLDFLPEAAAIIFFQDYA